MVSSFRLNDEDEKLLNRIAKKTGKSRSQLVREAIQTYCSGLTTQTKRSLYDRLIESGFKPAKSKYTDLSANKDLQRKLIGEKVSKNSN